MPQVVTAVVAVLAFGLSLYNFYLQRWGKVHCQIFERQKKGLTINELHKECVYTFDVRFFNEKGMTTGLRDCIITFLKNGDRQFDGIKIFPKDSMSQLRADALTFESQEFTAKTLK